MKEGSKAYNNEAIQLALSRVEIAPCIDCGHPVDKGYCCNHCGGGNGHTDTSDCYEVTYNAMSSVIKIGK